MTEPGDEKKIVPPEFHDVVDRLDRLWADPRPLNVSVQTETRIGPYLLEKVVGHGTFGIVYKAHNEQLNRDVALKIPRPEVLLDQEKLERFAAEARVTARLQHPAIVPLFEAELNGATPYLATAFCIGPNLHQWLKDNPGPQPAEDAVSLVQTLADAVDYAHQNGVVHRDLKPANVLMEPVALEEYTQSSGSTAAQSLSDYLPRITDFGLSRLADDALIKTQSGAQVGTPIYMSPEQAAGTVALHGPATDIYALGAILYQLITGGPPFTAATEFLVMDQILNSEPVAPNRRVPNLPQDLNSICLKCLEKKPAQRYLSAQELRSDLDRFVRGEPVVARPVTAVARAGRWARRSPAKASLVVLSLCMVASTMAGLVYHSRTVERQAERLKIALKNAEEEKTIASVARDEAEAAKQDSQLQAKAAIENSYRANISLAFQMHRQGRCIEVDKCLEQARSQNADLRGPEWYVLNSEHHARWQHLGRHEGEATECVVSPDRQLAYSSGIDGQVKIWDLTTGTLRRVIEPDIGEIHAMALSPDGKTLAVGGKFGLMGTPVTLINVDTGSRISKHQSHKATIDSIAFSADGVWLAGGSRYQNVQLTRLETGENFSLDSNRRNQSLTFSSSSESLAFVADDGYVGIWDTSDGKPTERRVPGYKTATPYIAKFGNRLPLLATVHRAQNFITFTSQTNKTRGVTERALEGDAHSQSARFEALGFNPDDTLLAAGDQAGSIVFWNLAPTIGDSQERLPLSSVTAHQGAVSCVEFIDDSSLISTGGDGGVCVTSVMMNGGIHHHWPNVNVGAVTVYKNRIFLACTDQKLRSYQIDVSEIPDGFFLDDPEKHKSAEPLQIISGCAGVPESIDISTDGNRLAVGFTNGRVAVYDSATIKLIRQIAAAGSSSSIKAIAFSADDQRIVYTSSAGCQQIDIATGEQVFEYRTKNTRSLQFVDSEKALAIGNNFRQIDIIDSNTGKLLRKLPGNETGVMALSPDQTRLASGHDTGRLQMIDLESGDATLISLHRKAVQSVVFSKNGRTLISIDESGEIIFTDGATSTELGRMQIRDVQNLETVKAIVSDSWFSVVTSSQETTESNDSGSDLYIWALQDRPTDSPQSAAH